MLLVAISPLILTSCNKSEDIVLDFDITVPDNWIYQIRANEGLIYAAGREATDNNDTIRESLYIVKESLPNRSLNGYYNLIRPYIVASVGHDSILYESDTVINATDFKKMISMETQKIINMDQDTFDLSVITDRYFFYEKENAYNMVFISMDTLYYKQNKAIFDEIMSSFHYKN